MEASLVLRARELPASRGRKADTANRAAAGSTNPHGVHVSIARPTGGEPYR